MAILEIKKAGAPVLKEVCAPVEKIDKDLRKLLDDINQEMDNPLNNDSYYGKVDCLLTEMEELVANFNKTK